MINVLIHFWSKYRGKFNVVTFKTVLFVAALLWYATSGYLFFEIQTKPDLNWNDALWWALVTMTTVGYGDYFPESILGRYLVGVPTMLFGIGLLGFVLSEVASKLIESKSRRLRGMSELSISNHVLIINFPNLEKTMKLIEELKSDPSSKNKKLCLIDETLDELPIELAKLDIEFVRGNPTKESVLQRACLATASHAIILTKDPSSSHADDQNLTTILMLENMNSSIITVAECMDPEKIRQFKAAGCDRIVCLAPLTTNLLVQEMQDPGIQQVITELTSNVYGQQLYLTEIKELKEWTAAELIEWSITHGFVLIGIKRGENILLNCQQDFNVDKDDRAVLLGSTRPALIIVPS